MDCIVALKELRRHFLGEEWYVINPINYNQMLTEMLFEIEMRYKGDKKAWKKLLKEEKRKEVDSNEIVLRF